jgi:hypothetical protein
MLGFHGERGVIGRDDLDIALGRRPDLDFILK